MKKILKVMGFGLASASMAAHGVSYAPYKNDGVNVIYNLLFCDNRSLFQESFTGDVLYPWDVLFSSNSTIEDLKKIATDSEQEGRVRMLAFNRLREMNEQVPKKELLGVIIEVGMKGGLDTLAVFNDGGVRYINYTGKMAVFEGGAPSNIESKSKEVLSASQRIVNAIGPWDKNRLPPPKTGMIRMTFLVSDGLYFGEGNLSVMQTEQLAAPLVQSSGELLQLIVETFVK
jgi:hypothetical protein